MIILAVVVLAVIVWVVLVFNNLVTLRNQVANAFKQIDVQLKRRYDLIPNLINSVKGEMKFEQSTLEKVIQAREQADGSRYGTHKRVEIHIYTDHGREFGNLSVSEGG